MAPALDSYASARRTPRTILVVEDDLDVLEAVRERLTQEGFLVRTATDGQQALDDLASNSRPDLILLDLKMPVRSGWEFLEAMRRSDMLVTIPVVVISSYLGYPPAGAVAWVKKPFQPDQLVQLVRQHSVH